MSLHLPVTFASIWPEPVGRASGLRVELIEEGADGQARIAMGAGPIYQVVLHATRADVARLLWPEEEEGR